MNARITVSLAFALVAAPPAVGGTLTLRGDTFLMDGKPFDMWGVRVASASRTRESTDHLIAQLDDYLAHGVNSVSVYYMGSSAGYGDPFAPDGTTIDPDHQRRMEEIVRACDRRGMAVIVGVFYQRSDAPRLKDWDACKAAVRTVARSLKPYRNVILNIANEQNSERYKPLPWGRVTNPADVIDLCRIAKAEDPDRLVGGGGYEHGRNETIGKSKDVDVLLFDTSGPTSSATLYERFRAAGVTDKPMVNVEMFGAWTNEYLPQGVFPEAARRAYLNEVDAARRIPGLYLHLHNTPWFQAFTPGEKSRYDLGGRGTKDDPGVRWYFEAVKAARAGQSVVPPRPAINTPAGHYEEKDGIVVLEAEDLRRSDVWEVSTEPTGYTGSGWLWYVGPSAGEGTKDGHNVDASGKYQGDPRDRLAARVKVNAPGEYVVRGRVRHVQKDGDNDAWVNLAATPNGARRWGDSRAARGTFGWNDFNCWTEKEHPCRPDGLRFRLEKGVHEIYWAGRSWGFGIDRLVLHLPDKEAAALDLKAPPTPLTQEGAK